MLIHTVIADMNDEINVEELVSSTLRSGVVTFTVEVDLLAGGDGDWSCVFPNTVTVSAAGGGGGKKKDSGGCSTDSGHSHWLVLLAALSLIGLAARQRGARA